jgi:cation diffusion facilitator CzcD-associated flavoprotein CzcO
MQVEADGKTLVSANGDVIPDVDVIIFATGFDLTASISQFDIRARGHDLNETYHARPEAYFGMAMAGFPNMFTLLGLNTGG